VLGIKTLRASSECLIQWSAIYFAFNQDKIDTMQQIATDLGCNRFQTVKSSKFDGRYSVDGVDTLKPTNSFIADTLVYITDIKVLTAGKYIPVVPAVPPVLHPWARCLNFKKDVFIGVDGVVTPCPWFNNGYQRNDFLETNKEKLSIKNRSFFDILDDNELWSKLVDRFNTDPLEICQLKCKNGQ
jgi:MoaA/NifB/PqqE/SkfB family radical SAM enzyme